MDRNSKHQKYDIGLLPQTISNSNVTGPYYHASLYRVNVAHLIAGAMAATKTTIIEFLQATSSAGAGAKGIPTTVGQSAIATITANTKVTKLTLALSTVLAADTVTITFQDAEGVETEYIFTAEATTTTKADREFSISGDNSADADELVSCINDATYGIPGVTASNNAGTITLIVTDPGEGAITAETSGATVTIATVEAQAYVEISSDQLDDAGGFEYIACKVTTTGNTPVSVALLRGGIGGSRFNPQQQVGAYAEV